MRDRLVVGYDGSATSVAALDWAGAEAAMRGASLRVISSYAMPPLMNFYGIGTPSANAPELRQLEESCEAALRAAVDASVRRHPSVAFDFQAVDRPAGQSLVDEAKSADLLVVGSNGLGATTSFLLGSVAGLVLHESPCPVVVVPAEPGALGGRIAVGIDGSHQSTAALNWAADDARRRGARLVVVHAWEYPYRVSAEAAERGTALAQADAAIVLERYVDSVRPSGSGPVTGQLAEGPATHVLLGVAKTVDLLVVGSRGRGGFRSMLLGSVAHALCAHSTCPVAVIR